MVDVDVAATVVQSLDGGISPQDLLMSQLDTSDPKIALIAQFLNNRMTRIERLNEEDEGNEAHENELLQQRLQKLSDIVRQQQKHVEVLQTELEEFRLRNDTLASGVGACYLCWGENVDCEVCHGKGTSGHFPIDVRVFAEYILPAVRAVKRKKTPTSAQSEAVQPRSEH